MDPYDKNPFDPEKLGELVRYQEWERRRDQEQQQRHSPEGCFWRFTVPIVFISGVLLMTYSPFTLDDLQEKIPSFGHPEPTNTATGRLQSFYDEMSAVENNFGYNTDTSHLVDTPLVRRLDPSVFRLWTPHQCALSIGNNMGSNFPNRGKITSVDGPRPYAFTLTDSITNNSSYITMTAGYVIKVRTYSGDKISILLRQNNGALTWFTTCDQTNDH